VEDTEGARRQRKPCDAAGAPATPTWRAPSSTISNDARDILEAGQRPERRARGCGRLAKRAAAEICIQVFEPRDRRRPGRWRLRSRGRELWSPAPAGVLLGCVRRRNRSPHESGGDEAYLHGRYHRRVFRSSAHGVPNGAGITTTWDSRLDGRLAQPSSPCRAVKGSKSGFAAEGAASFGRRCRTHPLRSRGAPLYGGANRAGGLEGASPTARTCWVRLLKPISTLRRPLDSVDRPPGTGAGGLERSDVAWCRPLASSGKPWWRWCCAGVSREIRWRLAGETRRNFEGYLQQVGSF